MSRATDDLMDLLHRATAQQLADIIQKGIIITDREGNVVTDADGEPLRNPAPAAYIAAAIKFLKDNDITADPNTDRFDPLKDTDRVKTPVGFPDIHAGDMLSHGTYLR